MPYYGQLVIGPPGSGKTTYCSGMSAYLNVVGRPCAVVNLDPANEDLRYNCSVDVSELVALEEVMEQLGLGPNGGLVYSMEFLAKNIDWLVEKLTQSGGPLDSNAKDDQYLLLDCPGQVELFTHNSALKEVIQSLAKRLDLRMVAVHLVDSHHCTDAATYISATMLSLSTMLQLELPHINVLSKIDNLERYGTLAFNGSFYSNAVELERLVPYVGSQPMQEDESPTQAKKVTTTEKMSETCEESDKEISNFKMTGGALGLQKYRKLNSLMCDLVQQFSMVSFMTLNVMDPLSMETLLKAADKAIAYIQKAKERKAKVAGTTYLDQFRQMAPEGATATISQQQLSTKA
jgi:GPN-loop GTPase